VPGAHRHKDAALDPVEWNLGLRLMRAPTANDQFGGFSLGNLSYIGPSYEEADAPVVKPEGHGLTGWMHTLAHRFANWQRRRAVLQEMALMTDHELTDIGLTRADLPRVFDTDFAADHARGRDYIAY
jgi:uncharacterized protein YjiS (DUF1127 family)